MPRTAAWFYLAAATTALTFLTPGAAAASPSVYCGATLLHDTTLDHDLTCAGDGLVLGPGVTLDLRGHTLRGPGSHVGVSIGTSGAAIVHGRLTGWGSGIAARIPEPDGESLPEAATALVRHIRVDHSDAGVDASAGMIGGPAQLAFDVRDSRFADNSVGIGGLVARVHITRTSMRHNTFGVRLDTTAMTASHLQLRDNRWGVVCIEAACTVTSSVLRDNVTGVESSFVGEFELSGSVITGSETAYTGVGFLIGHTVRHNVFAHNGTGVTIFAGGGTVAANLFFDNGIALTASEIPSDFPLNLGRNLLVRNGDAISMDDATNVAVGANRALHNQGWGIRVPGATDLGGNVARGNGNSPQCVGVVCT